VPAHFSLKHLRRAVQTSSQEAVQPSLVIRESRCVAAALRCHAKRREGSVATQDEIINRRAVAVAIVFGLASLILVILTFAK
jgi:hypothetical protein